VQAVVCRHTHPSQPQGRWGFSFLSTILFIDGRNVQGKLTDVLNPTHDSKVQIDFATYDFAGLFRSVLSGITVDCRIFYFGRLQLHKETKEKSLELIEKQRALKSSLEKQGFEVVLAGRVRGHLERCPKGHETLTFKEKGVDVRMAVDMITLACEGVLKTAIVASSDSDLQPAIKGLRELGAQSIYVGFERQPNKGLSATTTRTILIRTTEIEAAVRQTALLASVPRAA